MNLIDSFHGWGQGGALARRTRVLARLWRIVSALCLPGLLVAAQHGYGSPSRQGNLIVEWNVPVSAPGDSLLNWYELKADPEDANKLIVCGAKRNSKDNAYYGVVYFSYDAGKSWKPSLEDQSSAWVSEQSCAFGKRHTAYFVSGASKVIDGHPHHDLGTTHIFVSLDAGATWSEAARTGWADYSTAVVGNPPGGRLEQLYVVYQGLGDADGRPKHPLDFFTVSIDGKSVSAPQTVLGTTERNYQGIYPTSSVALTDGTPVILYDAVKGTAPESKTIPLEIGAVRFTSSGPSKPIVIAHHAARYEAPMCPATLSNSLVYDRARNTLYAAYNDLVSGHCAVMLTSSSDGGQSWSPPHELSGTAKSPSSLYFPVLGINEDGVIGLSWRGKSEKSPGCWFFSISRDGVQLDDTVSLSRCADEDSLRKQSSGYLATVIQRPAAGQPVSIKLLTFRDNLLRVGATATSDGVFHPLWSALADGKSDLRTARIQVGNLAQRAPPARALDSAVVEITEKITILYGGEQRLDHETKSVMLNVSFRNDSARSISTPLYLKVETPKSDFGDIELVNPGRATGLGADYLDISSSVRGEALAPGETSSPYHLTFRFSGESSAARSRRLILEIRVRVFCRQDP